MSGDHDGNIFEDAIGRLDRAFHYAVYDFMGQEKIDMRTAAYALALGRIGAAIASQGTASFFAGE